MVLEYLGPKRDMASVNLSLLQLYMAFLRPAFNFGKSKNQKFGAQNAVFFSVYIAFKGTNWGLT